MSIGSNKFKLQALLIADLLKLMSIEDAATITLPTNLTDLNDHFLAGLGVFQLVIASRG